MHQITRLTFYIVVLGLLTSCGNNPEVSLRVDRNNVQAGDTIRITVEHEHVNILVVNFGDGRDTSIDKDIPNVGRFNYAYDSMGTYYPEAFGFNDDDVDSDFEMVEVQ